MTSVEMATALGRKGAIKRWKNTTPEQRRAAARHAALARWAKKK